MKTDVFLRFPSHELRMDRSVNSNLGTTGLSLPFPRQTEEDEDWRRGEERVKVTSGGIV